MNDLRTPFVTANGIILGFVLNFAANWTKQESVLGDLLAYVVAFSLLVGTIFLIASMFMILKLKVPIDGQDAHYQRVFCYFLLGVSLSFGGAFVDLFVSFMS